jgi:CubicO group peptidase (beta-lactamase class C family)
MFSYRSILFYFLCIFVLIVLLWNYFVSDVTMDNQNTATSRTFEPVFPGKDLQTAVPESQGVDSAVLNSALDYFNNNSHGTGSSEMVIVRNGYIIRQGESADAFHSLYSGTKAFTTTVMGLLIQQGVISSVENPVINYLPDLDDEYPEYADITFKHLASFTSGYNADNTPVANMQWGDPEKFLTPLKPLASPGTKFQYFDPAIHQLGNILTITSGDTLENIFKTGIADVIGMTNWKWYHHGYYDNGKGTKIVANFLNPSGIYGGGIHITPLDVARFGLLYLNRGNWNGKQILSSKYVDEATTNQVPVILETKSFDKRGNFGYMWYTNDIGGDGTRAWPSAPPKAYTFQGNGRNYCFVIPEWNMVISRMSPPDQESMNDQIWEEFFYRLKPGIFDFPLP